MNTVHICVCVGGNFAVKKEQSDYEKEMEREIESRLFQLESENYDFGKRFGKLDWILVVVTVLAGLAIILCGIK